MTDLSQFDSTITANPNNNIFGLPFNEEQARVIILPVPWEVTVRCSSGTARAPEHIFKASLQVNLFDSDNEEGWKQGFYMKNYDKKVLLKSDYLRKEAELYIGYISKGEQVMKNTFMSKSLKEINEGSLFLNNWVYEQTKELLNKNKLVGLLGGDHSTPLGFYKALAEKHGDFGILQIDAHCDLRKMFQSFTYSHASIMYNALSEIPQLKQLLQVGARDYGHDEWEFICSNKERLFLYSDKKIKERQFEGETWKQITDEIVGRLPDKVHFSFDIDGLDPKSCPNSGAPVPGGMETEQVFYLIKSIIDSGRKLIGFDLCEVGTGENNLDASVGARILWRLCNMLLLSNG
ncbi:MAG: arginase family protein [Chitinophagaceae bacterium]